MKFIEIEELFKIVKKDDYSIRIKLNGKYLFTYKEAENIFFTINERENWQIISADC